MPRLDSRCPYELVFEGCGVNAYCEACKRTRRVKLEAADLAGGRGRASDPAPALPHMRGAQGVAAPGAAHRREPGAGGGGEAGGGVRGCAAVLGRVKARAARSAALTRPVRGAGLEGSGRRARAAGDVRLACGASNKGLSRPYGASGEPITGNSVRIARQPAMACLMIVWSEAKSISCFWVPMSGVIWTVIFSWPRGWAITFT